MGWRLSLHRQISRHCQLAQTPFARFLALVPDRLRLARGASIRDVRLPLGVPAEVRGQFAEAFVDHDPGPAARPTTDARRLLRLAQIDGDLDLFWLDRWYALHGGPLIRKLTQIYAKGFDEVGAGAGGEETAYLVHLQLVDALATAITAARSPLRPSLCSLAATLLEVAMQAALEPEGRSHRSLPARLGLQFSATLSAPVFGLEPGDYSARPLNAYRTIGSAIDLAGRVMRGQIETIDLDEVVDTFTERLRRDRATQVELTRQILAEMVRDCALVLLLQHGTTLSPASIALRAVASSGRHLVGAVDRAASRAELLDALRDAPFAAEKPAVTLRGLLERADQALDGDTSVLGSHGNLTERAKLAASGAVALALDCLASQVAGNLRGIVDQIPPEQIDAAYAEGRCYRLHWDTLPLYRSPKPPTSAVLYIETSDLAERLLTMDSDTAVRSSKASFYDPTFALAASLTGPERTAIRLCRFSEAGLAFEGDIVALLDLAIGVRRIVDQANQARHEGVADALGGTSSRQQAIDTELAGIAKRLEEIDRSLHGMQPGGQKSLLLVERQSLTVKRSTLVANREAIASSRAGKSLEVGLFISAGAPAKQLDDTFGGALHFSTLVSRGLVEAAWACRRSAPIADERRRTLEAASRASGRAEPVFVSQLVVQRFALSKTTKDAHTEIHNVGCGISKAALDAFRQERSGVLSFEKVNLSSVDLDERMRTDFIFDSPNHALIVARRDGTARPVLVFRKVGSIDVGRPGAEHPIEAWEVIDGGSPFVGALFERVDVSAADG